MPEHETEIFADASKIPFQVRPIDLHGAQNLHTKPVSLPNDLSGNLTLSSKHVAFPLGEFVETLGKKDISAIVGQKSREEIILNTETVLQIARAPDAEETEIDPGKFWAVPAIIGFLIAILAMVIWSENTTALFLAIAICAVISGFSAGFLWREFWDKMLKEPFRKWVKENLE